MDKDCEIELKLAIDSVDAAAFRRLPLLRENSLDGPTRRKVFNAYFDTPDLLLKQNAMALRLRKIGGKWLQTLKTAGMATGGLHHRGEWEYPLHAPQLDLSLFRDTPLAALANSKQLHLTLMPAFTTVFNRTTWRVETALGHQVEVALDQGVIRCGDSEASISEVEIELLEGSAAAVFDIATALATQIALRPENLSKAERGYRLFWPEPRVARRADATALKRKWTSQQALQSIVSSCLAHYVANVDGALNSDAPEYIHQLRVAMRRLRSAIRTFKPANAEAISMEVKWLADALGDARDWDVLLMDNLPVLLDGFGDPSLAKALMATGRQRQAEGRRFARAALASPRATLLVLAIARWAAIPGELTLLPAYGAAAANTADAPAMKLSQFASQGIRRRHRRLLKDSATLAELTPEARHQVRIDAKRLRYAVDFFSSLFSKTRVERYEKILGRMQDLLGETNDDVIAMTHIESLAPPERFVDFARGWFAARTLANLAGMDPLIADLNDAKRFWGKNHEPPPATGSAELKTEQGKQQEPVCK